MRVRCPECDVTLRIPAEDAGRTVECPDCDARFRVPDIEDDDRPRRPAKKSRGGGGTNAAALVGTGVAALAAAGAIIWVLAGRPKPPADDKPARPPEVAQQVPAPQPGVVPPELPGAAALTALFRQPVDAPPPTRRLVRLEPAGGGGALELPALPPAKPADPAAARLTADEAKAATAYIKVGGGTQQSTGSGFLVAAAGRDGLVATNRHVVEAALARPADGGKPPPVTVVFHSNVPGKEVSLPAAVVAVHPDADLAVLRVPGRNLPARPIDPFAAPPAATGTDVQILGFPLGENLARGGANPDISVSPGSVSSLRRDRDGKLEQVQITGPLIPGNSGGPIVDKDGRLVGVAVSTLLGTGLGFAVPAADLVDLLAGKFRPAAVVPHALDAKTARFKVSVPLVDPLDRVRGVRLLYRTAGGRPEPSKDPKTGYALLEGAGRLDLPVGGPGQRRAAAGELALPADAAEAVLQLVAEGPGGAVVASPPAAFTLSAGDVATDTDAGPFADFVAGLKADPAGSAGRVRVVRGRVAAAPDAPARFPEVRVTGPDGRAPEAVRFLVDRETAAQFDELTPDQERLDARLVLVPGERLPDGRTHVRVARVDLLDEFGRPVKSIPGDPPPDPLAALNRDPDRYAGRSLEVTGAAVLEIDGFGGNLPVVLTGRHPPRNLRFVPAPELTQRLIGERFRPFALYPVRLAVSVSPRVDKTAPATLLVQKVELLDKSGKVLKTFE